MTRVSTTRRSRAILYGSEARPCTPTSAGTWTISSTRSARTRLTRSWNGSARPSLGRAEPTRPPTVPAVVRSDRVAVGFLAVAESGGGGPGEAALGVLGQVPAG